MEKVEEQPNGNQVENVRIWDVILLTNIFFWKPKCVESSINTLKLLLTSETPLISPYTPWLTASRYKSMTSYILISKVYSFNKGYHICNEEARGKAKGFLHIYSSQWQVGENSLIKFHCLQKKEGLFIILIFRDFVVDKISELLSKTTIEPTNSPLLTAGYNLAEIPKVEPLMSLFKEEVDLTSGNSFLFSPIFLLFALKSSLKYFSNRSGKRNFLG